MKLIAQKDVETIRRIVTDYYDEYNIINNSQVDHDTYFIVVEKYFFRTGNRASLSIVLSRIDEDSCKIESVGSGGGQGLIFKFDWGVKGSFEAAIPTILSNHNISYTEV